jgi:shikimate dehydrogenase
MIEKLPSKAIAYDLIYTPNPTLFLQQAKTAGAITIDGLEMLVQQGAAALEIWLDRAVPVEIMRRSLRTAFTFKKHILKILI